MQVNRVVHHGVVHHRQPVNGIGSTTSRERLSVERPHESLHVPGEMHLNLPARERVGPG